jgi:hypothetical protein
MYKMYKNVTYKKQHWSNIMQCAEETAASQGAQGVQRRSQVAARLDGKHLMTSADCFVLAGMHNLISGLLPLVARNTNLMEETRPQKVGRLAAATRITFAVVFEMHHGENCTAGHNCTVFLTPPKGRHATRCSLAKAH